MSTTDSRQRTVPVTCATSARTMSAGSVTGLTSALATTAPFFRDLDGAFDRRLVARHHDLSAAIVVRGLANFPVRGLRRDRCCLIEVKPEQCRHGAGAHWHRFLHCATANAQEPRRVGNGERASGGER